MDVGRMNKRLALQTNSPSTDEGGGLVDSRSTAITVWGSLEPLRGYEQQVALGIDASLTHKAVIRYNSRFNPRGQVTHDSRTFRIHSVRDIRERGHKIEMLLSEEV